MANRPVTSREYKLMLNTDRFQDRGHGMRASMSRRGNRYDNAPVESYCGTLKEELVHHCRY